MRRNPSVVLASLAMCVAAAAPARRLTAEGQPLPEAGPRVVTLRLPLSGTALGGLPEEVPGCAKPFAIDSLSPVVVEWRRQLVANHVDTAGYDYVGSGTEGARCVLIGLTDGRVSRLAYLFPGLTPDRAKAIVRPFRAAGADEAKVPGGAHTFRVTQGGVRVYGSVAGDHAVTVTEVHTTTLRDYNAGDSGASTRVDRYPSCIALCVDPVDWYLVAHPPAPAVATAMREGRPTVGMTLAEARLALGSDGTAVGGDGRGEAFHWAVAPGVAYVAAFEGGQLVRFRQE